LISKERVEGVLEVMIRQHVQPDSEWLEFLEMLAGQAAIALENATLFNELQKSNQELSLAYDTTLEGWSKALDLRDQETEGHAQRVTDLTISLARKLNLSNDEIVHLRRGALLHDIGKMGIPDQILLKPAPLTDEEWSIMRKHPEYAYALLSPIKFLDKAVDIPHYHHERWDGKGYPKGLRGEEIPLTARIFAVVDVWDALSTDRPYRAKWSRDMVKEHLISSSGTHFDPQVVFAFLTMLEEEDLSSPANGS
jgi:putative nucleotidyltransferase with HDIG domain